MYSFNLWLDDMRPAPEGYIWAKTVDQAKAVLANASIVKCSLDHDLGVCTECSEGLTPEEWLIKHEYKSMPHCSHFGTGYDLVCWMEENDVWSIEKPVVHSMNPVGRMRMQMVIDKKWSKK